MGETYVVQQGDWLSKIAAAHGYDSWKEIYYHPDNAAFRAKRPDPDLIYPGDVLVLPDRDPDSPGGDDPPEPSDKTYTATGGETLCHIAHEHGFPHCKRLREVNSAFADVAVLKKGDKVTIPEIRVEEKTKSNEAKHKFVRPSAPPEIYFVREDGNGYPATPVPSSSPSFDPHFPKSDPELRELNLTNYHINKAGDGTAAFAGEADFEHDLESSRDTDHFKVQVYDPKTTGDTIEVTLCAMRPEYTPVVAGTAKKYGSPSGHRFPASEDRKLKVSCKRIPTTKYFRSPYLRLVTTESDQAERSKQSLLVTDYYGVSTSGTPASVPGFPEKEQPKHPTEEEKPFVEILDHKVRGLYDVPICEVKKCVCVKDREIKLEAEIQLAVHVMTGSGRSLDDLREQIYKWMRRCLAQAHLRPHIKKIHTVAVPANMITLSDGDGRHARGKDASDAESKVTVQIDGHTFEYKPTAGDSPSTTAGKLKDLIEDGGYQVKGPFPVKVDGLAPVPNAVSSPQDMVILKGDGSLATVTSVHSTDTRQGIVLTDDTNVNDFKVDWPFQHRDGRSLHYNYRTDHFDIFVAGTTLKGVWNGGGLFGFSPYGAYDGWNTDIGPITFLNAAAGSASQKPFNPTHEMMHPLMHAEHTRETAGNKEIMNASTSTADGIDATKHICDAPIDIKYNVIGYGIVRLNGQEQTGRGGKKITETATSRLMKVSKFHNVAVDPSARSTAEG